MFKNVIYFYNGKATMSSVFILKCWFNAQNVLLLILKTVVLFNILCKLLYITIQRSSVIKWIFKLI